MGLLDKLTTEGSVYTDLDGANGPHPDFKGSKLHDEYSINGDPNVIGKPNPSLLDMDGLVPDWNYRNTAPEGRTF